MRPPNLKLGTAFGIDVLLHWSFFLLPLAVVWLSIRQEDSAMVLALRLALLMLILASVLWHELGHALAGRAFGIPTQDILITPICGLARLLRAPDSPRDEIVVALAGPLANGLVAATAAAIAWAGGLSLRLGDNPLNLHVLPAIFWINLALFGLNLIPIFPMDGGRILRAVLAGFMNPRVATLVAGRIGQVGSLVAIAVGLIGGNPALTIVGIFLWIMAEQEIRWNRLMPPAADQPEHS